MGLADADQPAEPGSAAGSWSRLRRSRSSLPALRRGPALPGTATFAPVRGLRPTRSPRPRVENMPKPRSSTRSPRLSAAPIRSNTVSTIRSRSRRWRCGLAAASRLIRPDLVMTVILASQPSPARSTTTAAALSAGVLGWLRYAARCSSRLDRKGRVPPRAAKPDVVSVPPRLTAEVGRASSSTSQPRPGGGEDDHADQSQEQPDGIEEGRRRRRWPEAQRAAAAAAAVQGAGGGDRARALAARRGGAQGLGLHQAARAAGPGEPARDPGRQQAGAGVREKEGDHVRDEQAPGAAPEVRPPGRGSPERGP